MKKKVICIVLAVALLAVILVGCSSNGVNHQADVNVLSNSTFESNDTDWSIVSSGSTQPKFPYTSSGANEYEADHGHVTASLSAFDSGSYMWLSQTVAVMPHKVYHLTVDYKITSEVDVSENGRGAYVEILDFEFASAYATAKSNTWQTLSLYFDTDKYEEVSVALGLGDKQYKVTSGTVLFDNVSLSLVDDALVVTKGHNKYVEDGSYQVINLASGGTVDYRASYRSSTSDIVFMVLVVVLGAALMVCLYFVLRRNAAPKEVVVEQGGAIKGSGLLRNNTFLLICSLLIAFVVRLVISVTTYGYGAFQNELMANAAAMAEKGLFDYYLDSTVYAPGAMYILYILGLLAVPLKLTVATQGYAIFIKIPAIIADLLTVLFVFNAAAKAKDGRYAFWISLALGLCPVFFMASTLWSAYASIGVLFLVLTALAVKERAIIKMTVFYVFAVLFMEEALLLLPLLLTYGVMLYIRHPETRIKLPVCATVAIIGGYVLTIPLTVHWFAAGHPFIVLENYVSYFSQTDYFARNIFNLYGMVGVSANAVNTAGNVCSAIFAALAMLGAIAVYIKCRNRQTLILLGAWTLVAIYMLCVRMNIWILLAAMVLLLVYILYTQEKRLMWVFGAFSVLTSINLCYVMKVGANIKGGYNAAGVTVGSLDPVMILFSIFAVITFFAFTYVAFDVALNRKKLLMPLLLRGEGKENESKEND